MFPAPEEAAFRDDLIAWATSFDDPPHPADLCSVLYTFLGAEYAAELIEAIADITGS